MNNLRDKNVNISTLVENQLPFFVAQSNRKFVSFLSSYYESLETKFQPLDIVSNLIEYYNIGYYNKSDLIESTSLTQNLLSTAGSTTIQVLSTEGFPEKNGYIQINDEFIFYTSKTDTQFLNCERGTSAFVLERTLSSNVVFKSSVENPDYNPDLDINKYASSHEAGSAVYNLSYYFVQEFFRRIKSEIAVEIPEKLVSDLNLVNFIKNIKSFYSSKGSLNAHKILFRILFNDKKIKIRTVNRGTGAKLRVFNYSGKVDGIKIDSGGQNYNPLKQNNVLVSPPIVEIVGSGSGTPSGGIIPKTASVKVTDINSNGTITSIAIEDKGIDYIGPITARVRERSFTEDQIVTNDEGTGRGRVEYWDFNSNELILYDVEGYFRIGDTIRGEGKEQPVTTISKAYPVTPDNPEGNPSIQVISLDPSIEYPKDYILKPSSSTFKNKKIIKCKSIFNSSRMFSFDRIISLVQEKDLVNGVAGVTIESSEYNVGLNNSYEFDIDINSDYKNLYLPQSSVVTLSKSNIAPNTEFVITVDDCYGYPLENGYVYLNGYVIEYKSRSSNQFFGCKHKQLSSINIVAGDEVFEYGVKKYNTNWTSASKIVEGDIVYYELNAYKALNSGTTSTNPPTHTSGIKSDVLFGIKWEYIGKNIIKRSLVGYLDSNFDESNSIEFILFGLVSNFSIEDSGSLYDSDVLKFDKVAKNLNPDPLVNTFRQNQSNVITNSTFSSFDNSTGVHSIYDYKDHIYVSSSAIPPYLNSTTNFRKQNCTNQKLLKRIPKNYSIQKNTVSPSKATKNIGISVDGVQIQSPVGNTIQYGYLEYIEIDQTGDYEVPSTTSQFDYVKYPVFVVNNSTTIKNTTNTTLVYMSARFSSIDLTKLDPSYLTGFTHKPRIKVINNNPSGNPVNFENAILDLSYNETTHTIDNILIRNAGNGYVVAPTIRIEGGGKDPVDLPLKASSGYIFKFRGHLISKQNYASVTDYNLIDVRGISTTVYKTIPSIVVDAGSDASIKVYVSSGKISTIELVNQGKNYYVTPTIQLIHPNGINGLIIAGNDESTGKITAYTVVDRGQNYTSNPIVKIIPAGTGGTANAKLKSWTFNLSTVLTNIDSHGGYVYNDSDSAPNGGDINRPVVLKENFADTIDGNQYLILKTTSSFNTNYSITSDTHSPIIGWAYDGNPIYGPYGYSNSMDSSSSIVAMTSRWGLNTTRNGGPLTTDYPLGTFIEDYSNTVASSHLDEHNGRYCVTPEFPNGVYAYFSTANNFPYIIGPTFYGKCDSFNLCSDRTNDKIPQVFTRVNNKNNQYFPKEYSNIGSTNVRLNSASGKVDSIIVENGGYSYSVGDKLIVDNFESGGIGFSGLVSKISGKNILNYSFVTRSLAQYVEFTTSVDHGLTYGDQVDIEYDRISTFTEYELNSDITINYHSNAKLIKPNSNTAKFYLDANKTIPFFDSKSIKLYSGYIEIKTDKCPQQFYVAIGSFTYGVTVQKYLLNGSYDVEIDSNKLNKFYIRRPSGFNVLDIDTIKYTTNSRSANGSIVNCIVSNKGVGYKSLPKIVGVESVQGRDCILQLNSSSIGSIKSISYTGFGDKFTSNRTVKYNVNVPFTAKIINNFEISSINVLNGGSNYFPTPNNLQLETDYILVNGQKNYPKYQFKIQTQFGIITEVSVVAGGYNLSEYPSITVYSDSGDGSGAVLTANLKRTEFPTGTLLTCSNGSVIRVLKYNSNNSTLLFEYVSGNNFEEIEENTSISFPNGQVYGNLISIKQSKIYAQNSSYSTVEPKFLNTNGFLSESNQKILDSNYYQDWSYTLNSNRNISEWKSELVKNTHAAGFKVFGKHTIEKRSTVFENTVDILRSSVVFKSNLDNDFKLKLKRAECKSQYVAVVDSTNFSVGNYVYGNITGALGIVIEKLENQYLHIQELTDKEFIPNEKLFIVSSDFITNPLKDLTLFYCFYNGLLQNPIESYYTSNDSIIPNFNIVENSSLYSYKLTTKFEELISYISTIDNTKIILKSQNGSNFIPESAQKLIVSIDGVVQNPNNYTVNSNVVTFSSPLNSNSNIFVLYHSKLNSITFTGSGLTRNINYNTSSSCKLIIFVNTVHQNTFSGNYTLTSPNVLTFAENPGSDVYGWYIDEDVVCSSITDQGLSFNTIISTKDCSITTTSKLIESNAVKNPNYFYEFDKKLLDGTFVANSNTIYGYDSSFITTYPEYSTSYVEVLNKITFNGSAKTFTLKYSDGLTYTPVNEKTNLIVYINNVIIDHDQYSVSGSNITFVQTYTSNDKCTIIDFNSGYRANNLTSKGANLDRLNVIQNGSRQTFNLSDKGVPQYVKNIGDLFVVKNGSLLRPNSGTQSISANKITFAQAPATNDDIKLGYFNRQLTPNKTKNVILDELRTFNGVQATWPISIDGLLISPISVYHLFVIRNGVYQRPQIDYTISGSFITFTTPPSFGESVVAYYSYNQLNQNFAIDSFKQVDGVNTRFALTTNYVSTSIASEVNLFVYKDGNYQKPNVDYTIGGSTNARYIDFTVAPLPTENIDIIKYTPSDVYDITNEFTQYDTTTLQGSNNVITNYPPTLIFVDGILQNNESWSYNPNNGRVTFSEFVSLALDKVTILSFDNNYSQYLDKITTTSGQTTYDLTVDGNLYSSPSSTDTDVIVIANGARLSPSVYNFNNSLITLPTLPAGSEVYIFVIGSSVTTAIDYINDNYSKPTYKLLLNYASVNLADDSDILVIRNGVVQNPTLDFTIGSGYITFSTNITEDDEIFLLYCAGNDRPSITNVSSSTITLSANVASLDYNNLIVYIAGVPQFYDENFTVSGNVITLSENLYPGIGINDIFVIKYANINYVDYLDDHVNGVRTSFRLLYNNQNLNVADVVQDADILVSVNGVIQYPGVQYTISQNRGLINFQTAPLENDDVFFIRMYDNQLITLSPVSGSNTVYDLSQSISTSDQENLIVFSNNGWKFNELGEYAYTTNSKITLTSPNTSQYIFAIKFTRIFHLLDKINTPFDGILNKFNLFLGQENFMPVGTIENDSVPSESSILVTKNGKLLDPGVDYTLQGDIKSQIQFTIAPISTDIISIKSVGSFLKLKTITSGFGGKIYSLQKQDNTDYYPNKVIKRPREHENQILVIKNGDIQSPLYDYYIDNNQIVFTNNVTGTNKIVILDFMGTPSDMQVTSTSYEVSVGDTVQISGESVSRKITEVLSPTVLKTSSYTGTYAPTGFSATPTIVDGKLTDITITNSGSGYTYPPIIRTVGSGVGAKVVGSIDKINGNEIVEPLTIQYSGNNMYGSVATIATSYGYVYKQLPLSTSSVSLGTELNATLTNSSESITVKSTVMFEKNTPVVSISSSTGSGASFRPFVSKGRIRKVEVLAGGSGYDDKNAVVTLSGGGGSGCVLELVLNSAGSVTAVNVKNSGEGYDTFKAVIANESTNKLEIIEYTDKSATQLLGCTRPAESFEHATNTKIYYNFT